MAAPFRFNEDTNLDAIKGWIENTYNPEDYHYSNNVGGKNVQLIDLWDAQGSLMTTARDTAMKYLTRFGKKGGLNKKDAYKAIHYTLLMLYAAERQAEEEALLAENAPVEKSSLDRDVEGPQPPEPSDKEVFVIDFESLFNEVFGQDAPYFKLTQPSFPNFPRIPTKDVTFDWWPEWREHK